MQWFLSQFQHLHRAPLDWSLPRYAAHALRITIAVWLVVTLACVLAGLVAGRPKKPFGEFQPYTIYTTFVMGVAAFVCWQCARLSQAGTRRLWLLMCVGFAFLAADDLLQIHENLDKLAHAILGADPKNRITDHLDDLIVLGYGLAGIILLYQRRREILNLRYFVRGVIWAVVFFLVMVCFDFKPRWLLENTSVSPVVLAPVAAILEEAFKGLGASMFFWTFVVSRQQYRMNSDESALSTTEAWAGDRQ